MNSIFVAGTLSGSSLIVVSVWLARLDWVRRCKHLIAFLPFSADEAHLNWCERLREEMYSIYSLLIQIDGKLEEMAFNAPEDADLERQAASPTALDLSSAASIEASQPCSDFNPAENDSLPLETGIELSQIDLSEDQGWKTEDEADETSPLETKSSIPISKAQHPVELPVSQPLAGPSQVESPPVLEEGWEGTAGDPLNGKLPDPRHQDAPTVPPALFQSVLEGTESSDRKASGLASPVSESLGLPDGTSESQGEDNLGREPSEQDIGRLPSARSNLQSLAAFIPAAVGIALIAFRTFKRGY
jgi:hypothetical protein